jgi:hypothetical protein
MELTRALTPNPAVERTAGSHALAAAAHRERWADKWSALWL